ncbi:MAG: ABC-2 family transporter protein [Oscillospiraceae bacterium]|nr:ABC-2 family transporter protein [Oscillospiraceae bacterium]
MGELKMYFKLVKMNLLSSLEYKGWWLMILQVVTVVVTDPLGTVFMFSRFGSIGPWTMERILLIYSISVSSYGFAESFCRGMDYFPWHILRTGGFDRLMLRPKSLFTQVAASYFHIHRLSRPLTGLGIIIWCLSRQGIQATPHNTVMLITALLGGTLLYIGIITATGGFAFFTIKTMEWFNILTFAGFQVTRIPMEYMPPALKNAFTFFFPMLVISYYPASAICGWGDSAWLGWLALPAGAAFFGFSLLIWRFGVRRYKSTGS